MAEGLTIRQLLARSGGHAIQICDICSSNHHTDFCPNIGYEEEVSGIRRYDFQQPDYYAPNSYWAPDPFLSTHNPGYPDWCYEGFQPFNQETSFQPSTQEFQPFQSTYNPGYPDWYYEESQPFTQENSFQPPTSVHEYHTSSSSLEDMVKEFATNMQEIQQSVQETLVGFKQWMSQELEKLESDSKGDEDIELEEEALLEVEVKKEAHEDAKPEDNNEQEEGVIKEIEALEEKVERETEETKEYNSHEEYSEFVEPTRYVTPKLELSHFHDPFLPTIVQTPKQELIEHLKHAYEMCKPSIFASKSSANKEHRLEESLGEHEKINGGKSKNVRKLPILIKRLFLEPSKIWRPLLYQAKLSFPLVDKF